MQTTIARLTNLWDRRGRDRMVFGYKLPVQSVPKVCQGLATGGGFLRVLRIPPPTKTDRHDITEILLNVALNTIP
jgi:hypothetical protein